jgi:uncharacterized protein (DUF433 family)
MDRMVFEKRSELVGCWCILLSEAQCMVNERIRHVSFDEDRIIIELLDGRAIAAPLAWFPRLLHAKPEQRNHWELAGGGYGIHWPDLDEDISTEGLLRGAAAPGLRKSEKVVDTEWFERNPTICAGETVIKGTRVPLRTILASLAEGDSPEEILADFPSVPVEAIYAARKFQHESP